MKYPDLPLQGSASYKTYRKFEMIPGLITWLILIGATLMSFLAPVLAAILVITFDLFLLIRTIIISSHSIIAYRKMRQVVKIDWLKKAREVISSDGLKFEEVYHLIIIPYFNEGMEILEPSVESIVKSNYPSHKIIISMSCEGRAGKEAAIFQEKLKEKYGSSFKAFLTNIHPERSDEMKIKSLNSNWAAQAGVAFLEKEKIPFSKVIVSNFDCDTCLHKEYLGATTYHFLKSKNRYRESYQPLPMYNNNIWDTIAVVRVISLSSSFWHMIESTRPERLVTFSSHSMSLQTLQEVNYWQRDVISDDSAIFWQCFIHFNGQYQTIPLFIPISMDATLADTFFKTLKNQYKQKRRWAYGIENFPRIAMAFKENKNIPFREKFRQLWIMLEGHCSWATASFLIILLGWLPLVAGGSEFSETVIAHNLPIITRGILIFAMVGLVVSMFISLFLLPPRPKHYGKMRYFTMIFQWGLVPFIAPIMGSLPAVDAQTRLIFARRFQKFWVSEKKRKLVKN